MKIILASKSPRRKELLSMITNEFEIIVSNADEKIEENLIPEEVVKKLAYIKAKTVFDDTKTMGDRIVIGSDTIVVKDEKIFGKPKNHDDAVEMLRNLRKDVHKVMTGIAILYEKNGKTEEIIDCDISKVFLTNINDEEIENWIATGEAYDKAGAYAIQGKFGVFIDKIEGNYYTVVGLPVHKVYKILKGIL